MKSEPVFGIAALLFDSFSSVYFIQLCFKKICVVICWMFNYLALYRFHFVF